MGNIAVADLNRFSPGQRIITFQQYTKTNILNNQLLMFFIMTDFFQKQLLAASTGTTVKGIKAEKLKTLLLPIPPVDEQQRILSQLKIILSAVDTL